jgi:hypothetical protein
MDKLLNLINELDSKILFHSRTNPAISRATVGWHIEHSLLVIGKTIKALENSDPKDYKWEFSLSRFVVYTMNRVPRGKGRAPEVVQPKEEPNKDCLMANISLARAKVRELDRFHPKQNFKHPYFGKLNVRSTTKFLRLHTKHHLNIINEIIDNG